jgi:large conductance mechanosensitive channel
VKKVWAEFRAFIMQGNVLDLAVAVIIGASFKAVVDSLVNDVLLPLISALVGKPDFTQLTFTLGDSVIRYGAFLTQILNFLIIGASLFVIIKAFEQLQMRRRRGEVDEPPPRTDVELLTEIRDELRAMNSASPSS